MAGNHRTNDDERWRLLTQAARDGADREELIEVLCFGFGYTRRDAEVGVDELLSDLANLDLAAGIRT